MGRELKPGDLEQLQIEYRHRGRVEPGVTDPAKCLNGSFSDFCQALVLKIGLPLAFPVHLEAQHIGTRTMTSLIQILALASNSSCVDPRNNQRGVPPSCGPV